MTDGESHRQTDRQTERWGRNGGKGGGGGGGRKRAGGGEREGGGGYAQKPMSRECTITNIRIHNLSQATYSRLEHYHRLQCTYSQSITSYVQ